MWFINKWELNCNCEQVEESLMQSVAVEMSRTMAILTEGGGGETG